MKKLYRTQDENDKKSGYFHLKNIQGPRNVLANNQIFYEIYLLTDSIPSEEDYDILIHLNSTGYQFLEPHYFDKDHEYRFIGFKDQ